MESVLNRRTESVRERERETAKKAPAINANT